MRSGILARALCLLLLLSILASVLVLPSVAQGIAYDDFSNVAEKDYRETVVKNYFTYDTKFSVASTDPARWNGFWPQTRTDSVADPLDPSNKVGLFFTSAASVITKNYLDAQETFVFATDLMIPTPEEGASLPPFVAVKLSGKELFRFTYQSGAGKYTWSYGGKTGYFLPDTWMRLALIVTPDPVDGMAAATLDVVFSGSLQDGDGQNVSYVHFDAKAHPITQGQFQLQLGSAGDGAAGVYMDDTLYATLGDFGPATVTQDGWDDASDNVKLDGKVTVTFYHDLDVATFDPAKVTLKTAEGADVPYTSMTFDPCQPDRLVFDFSENPLSRYTEYRITLPEGTRDIFGQEPYQPTIPFATYGNRYERPRELPLAEAPEGGYVMPDAYNTGYRCAESELVDFFEKYPLFSKTSTQVTITEELARAYNYEFSGFKLTGTIRVTATSPVYLHDFYIWGDSYYGIHNINSERLTVAWAECENSVSTMFDGENLTVSHVYCHDVKADHAKGASGQIYESCYFRDGGTRSPGAHADVIQITAGFSNKVIDDMKILGCRFDIPDLGFDHVANACIMLGSAERAGIPESQGYSNIQMSYNWFNGGGYTTYLICNKTDPSRMNYITYTDNIVGVGRRWGDITIGKTEGWTFEDLTYSGNETASRLDAGSVVFYGADGTRIYDVSDLSGSGKLLVNLANYTAVARAYRVSVELVDGDGNTVATFGADGSLVRNMSCVEYLIPSNLRNVLDENGNVVLNPENRKPIQELINFPDLPRNVSCEIDLAGLPADLTGYTLAVRVYDTTDGDTLIRSSVLSERVEENTLLPKTVYHTVTFLDRDGAVLKTERVKSGNPATAPSAPTLNGFVFDGWSCAFGKVTEDLTVRAEYTALYVVRFLDREGKLIQSQTVRAGASATAPNLPRVEGYRFLGWSADFSAVSANMETKAEYVALSEAYGVFVGSVTAAENVTGSLSARYAALAAATEAYQALPAEERTEAASAYGRLVRLTDAYRTAVSAANADAAKVYETALLVGASGRES